MHLSVPLLRGLMARAVTLSGILGLWLGTRTELYMLVLGAVILAAGMFLLQRDHRRSTGPSEPNTALLRRWRFWAALGTVAVGGLAAVVGVQYRVDGLPFAALLLVIVGLGGLLAEWRSSQALAPWRGPVILGLCAVSFFVGASQLTPGLPRGAIAAVAAGLFIAPIGISLSSEDFLDRALSGPAAAARLLALAAAGFALTSAAFVWLVSGPATLDLLLIGFVVAGVLVWLMTISAQGDIALLAIVAVAAAFSAHVDTDPLDEQLGADAGERVVVALGDSYMSGEGAEKFLDGTNEKGSNECRRAATAWMPQLFDGDSRGIAGATDLVFLACSGARGHQLYGTAQGSREDTARNVDDGVDRRRLNQLAHLERVRTLNDLDVELLVVSIGGNDAGFAAIGTACAAPGDCDKSPLADQWIDELPAVAAKLDAAYFEIARAVDGRFPVAVVPYPAPLTPGGCDGSLMSPGEHAFLTTFVEKLDETIEATAAQYGFRYVEPMERGLDGWRLCDRDKPGVNSVAIFSVNGLVEEQLNPANWLHNSFHPNEDGHRQLAGVFASWLDDQDDLPAPPRLAADARRPIVTEAERQARPCEIGETGPQVCDTDSRDWAVDQTTELVRTNLVKLGSGLLGLWMLSLAVVGEYRRRRGPELTA